MHCSVGTPPHGTPETQRYALVAHEPACPCSKLQQCAVPSLATRHGAAGKRTARLRPRTHLSHTVACLTSMRTRVMKCAAILSFHVSTMIVPHVSLSQEDMCDSATDDEDNAHEGRTTPPRACHPVRAGPGRAQLPMQGYGTLHPHPSRCSFWRCRDDAFGVRFAP